MVREVATTVAHSLKDHPFALAIVVINVLFILSAAWTLRSIAQAGERRDALIAQLVKECNLPGPRTSP